MYQCVHFSGKKKVWCFSEYLNLKLNTVMIFMTLILNYLIFDDHDIYERIEKNSIFMMLHFIVNSWITRGCENNKLNDF